jgi:outer membrane lipoprotein-sorting protein
MSWFRPLFVLMLTTLAWSADDSLAATLARMDTVAAGFKGMRADVRQLSHTAVINEDAVDTGTIAVRRAGPKDLRILVDFKEPNIKKVSMAGSKVQIYYPKRNEVEEYEVGKASALKDQIMMLAFGSNSRDLMSAYSIKLGGPEAIAGQETTRIELIPKDKDLLAHFPRIELWIANQTGITVQQKLHQKGGDYFLATYTNPQLASLTDAQVKLDMPKDVHKVKPQSR